MKPGPVREHTPQGEATTRERVLAAVVQTGPVTTGELARRLGLTAAAVRRHLEAMVGEGLLQGREAVAPAGSPRRPGRPAKVFVAAPAAHRAGTDSHGELAVDVLRYLAAAHGRDAVRGYADRRGQALRERYAPALAEAGDDVDVRTRALADLLGRDGFAASARPVRAGTAVPATQLCQGHCPVQRAAAEFPEICDAETDAFSALLGVSTRRLATLGHGDRVCTTHVPLGRPRGGPQAQPPRTTERTTTEPHTSTSPEDCR